MNNNQKIYKDNQLKVHRYQKYFYFPLIFSFIIKIMHAFAFFLLIFFKIRAHQVINFTYPVLATCFNQNGSLIAASTSKTLQIWSTFTKKLLYSQKLSSFLQYEIKSQHCIFLNDDKIYLQSPAMKFELQLTLTGLYTISMRSMITLQINYTNNRSESYFKSPDLIIFKTTLNENSWLIYNITNGYVQSPTFFQQNYIFQDMFPTISSKTFFMSHFNGVGYLYMFQNRLINHIFNGIVNSSNLFETVMYQASYFFIVIKQNSLLYSYDLKQTRPQGLFLQSLPTNISVTKINQSVLGIYDHTKKSIFLFDVFQNLTLMNFTLDSPLTVQKYVYNSEINSILISKIDKLIFVVSDQINQTDTKLNQTDPINHTNITDKTNEVNQSNKTTEKSKKAPPNQAIIINNCSIPYIYDIYLSKCKLCSSLCLICSQNDSSICEQCISGFVKNEANKCQPNQIMSPTLNIISFPNFQGITMIFGAFFVFLDDFWLYQYHNYTYNQQLQSIFKYIHTVKKLSFIPKFLRTSTEDTKLFDVPNNSRRLDYTPYKYKYIIKDQINFLRVGQDLYLWNIIFSASCFLIFAFFAYLCKDTCLRDATTKYRMFGWIIVEILQKNIQYGSFLFFYEMQTPFMQTPIHKLSVIIAVLYFFIILIIASALNCFYHWHYSKKQELQIIYRLYITPDSLMFLTFSIGVKGILGGFIHSYLYHNFLLQISSLAILNFGMFIITILYLNIFQINIIGLIHVLYYLLRTSFNLLILLDYLKQAQIFGVSISVAQSNILAIIIGWSVLRVLCDIFIICRRACLEFLKSKISKIEATLTTKVNANMIENNQQDEPQKRNSHKNSKVIFQEQIQNQRNSLVEIDQIDLSNPNKNHLTFKENLNIHKVKTKQILTSKNIQESSNLTLNFLDNRIHPKLIKSEKRAVKVIFKFEGNENAKIND